MRGNVRRLSALRSVFGLVLSRTDVAVPRIVLRAGKRDLCPAFILVEISSGGGPHLRAVGGRKAPLCLCRLRWRPPCRVRTPYPSPRAFIAATAAMEAAAVVK